MSHTVDSFKQISTSWWVIKISHDELRTKFLELFFFDRERERTFLPVETDDSSEFKINESNYLKSPLISHLKCKNSTDDLILQIWTIQTDQNRLATNSGPNLHFVQ